MQLPDYIPTTEVQRVCRELGLRDWTQLADPPKVSSEEAQKILQAVNVTGMEIPLPDFIAGLEVELEHGTRFKDANVTNNHPLLTGKIVLAHLKETMDYYRRLEVAELEGDLLKTMAAGNFEKAARKYAALLQAKSELAAGEAKQFS
jgi:Protein of unknown function (DUF5661)